MLDYKPNIVLSTKEYKVVGTRPLRHDGLDKVPGRARYGADILLPGLLYGKILPSPTRMPGSSASMSAKPCSSRG